MALRKPHGYWTLERCQKEARKYKTRKAWANGSNPSYDAAGRHAWRELCCDHMREVRQKWSLNKCKKSANKFSTIKAWLENDKNAYHAAHKNNWLGECTAHMVRLIQHGRWTKGTCMADARQYETRTKWSRAQGYGYSTAAQKGWLEDCCKHMKVLGDHKRRCVYRIFSGDDIYIGLTHDFDTRMQQHREKGKQVKWLINKYGENNVSYEKLVDYIDAVFAQKMEAELIVQYGYEGWNVLNIAKAGGLGGGVRRWTKAKLIEDSLKYKTRTDWIINSAGAYNAARKSNLLGECCAHMPLPMLWDEEVCLKDASLYFRRSDWLNKSSGGYAAAKRLGVFDKCTSHMLEVIRYTNDELMSDAKLYTERMQWKAASPKLYDAALSKGLLKQCTAHMKVIRKRWTKQDCISDALLYKSKGEWQKKSNSAYGAARRLGVFKECTAHMPTRIKNIGLGKK